MTLPSPRETELIMLGKKISKKKSKIVATIEQDRIFIARELRIVLLTADTYEKVCNGVMSVMHEMKGEKVKR